MLVVDTENRLEFHIIGHRGIRLHNQSKTPRQREGLIKVRLSIAIRWIINHSINRAFNYL